MHFRTQHRYDADPARVFAMLTDPGFLDGMFAGQPGMTHQVEVSGTRTVLRVDTPAPHQAARFTGDTLHVTLDLTWAAQPAPDGTRTGPMSVSVAKVPAELSGTATIAPEGAETTVTYEGEFAVRIPLIGRQLEQTAAPYVTRVLDVQQEQGRAWLASHNA